MKMGSLPYRLVLVCVLGSSTFQPVFSKSQETCKDWAVSPCACETKSPGFYGVVTCKNSEPLVVYSTLSLIDFPIDQLIITNINLTEVPARVFPKINSTQLRLSMVSNSIHSINHHAFLGLERALVHLDLRNNLLSEVPTGALSNMKILVDLYLSSNRITRITVGAFSGLLSLKNLFLGNNALEDITPHAFTEIPRMISLHLEANKLTRMPKALRNLKYLVNLNLARNSISDMPATAFTGLERHLTMLNLENNDLRMVPEAIKEIKALVDLKLGKNNIASINTSAFLGLDQLRSLFLDGNRLSEIPVEAFSRLSRLRILDLSNNLITHIPVNAFQNVRNLSELYLQNNSISSIDENGFRGPQDFRKINLTNNNLSYLRDLGLSKSGRLAKLDFSDNPLVCDCGLQWLHLLVKYYNATSAVVGLCYMPIDKRGQALTSISDQEICQSLNAAQALSGSIPLPSVVILLLTTLCQSFTV